jgi:hypothetical protein
MKFLTTLFSLVLVSQALFANTGYYCEAKMMNTSDGHKYPYQRNFIIEMKQRTIRFLDGSAGQPIYFSEVRMNAGKPGGTHSLLEFYANPQDPTWPTISIRVSDGNLQLNPVENPQNTVTGSCAAIPLLTDTENTPSGVLPF